MNWINVYGLIFIIIIMIPNIVYAIKCKVRFQNLWNNKVVDFLEQIGRVGCFAFMILIIPSFSFGFASDDIFAFYLIANTMMIFAYCLIWIAFFKRISLFRALALSILPSIIFLFSGIISQYIPLIVSAVIFAPCHIVISYKNMNF